MGTYIVTLRPEVQDVATQANRLATAAGGQLGRVYTSAIRGFSIEMSSQAAENMGLDPMVLNIEADERVHLTPSSR